MKTLDSLTGVEVKHFTRFIALAIGMAPLALGGLTTCHHLEKALLEAGTN